VPEKRGETLAGGQKKKRSDKRKRFPNLWEAVSVVQENQKSYRGMFSNAGEGQKFDRKRRGGGQTVFLESSKSPQSLKDTARNEIADS